MRPRESQEGHFSRRLSTAAQGLHLPSEEELLRGMTFFRDDIREDMREYCERLSRQMSDRCDPSLGSLVAVLEELRGKPTTDGLQTLARCLDGLEGGSGVRVEMCRLRCQYYLASVGNQESASSIVGEAAALALRDVNEGESLQMVSRTLAWGVTAHMLAGLTNIVDLHSPWGALAILQRNVARQFDMAIQRASRGRDPAHADTPVPAASVPEMEIETVGLSIAITRLSSSVGEHATAQVRCVVTEVEKLVRQKVADPPK